MKFKFVRVYEEFGRKFVEARCVQCGDLVSVCVDRLLVTLGPFKTRDEWAALAERYLTEKHGPCQPWPNPTPYTPPGRIAPRRAC